MISLIPDNPILIVDDEEEILFSYETTLAMLGYNNVITCNDSTKAMGLVTEKKPELILLDLEMPNISGQEFLKILVEQHPGIPVVIITGNSHVEQAVECMKDGAVDYIVKPIGKERLYAAVKKAISFRQLSEENRALKKRLFSDTIEKPECFSQIITNNKSMVDVFKYIEALAETSQSVLLFGETGVGKELAAKATHDASNRKGQFVAVNAGGVDEHVFADTLFGHHKGAFTGAEKTRKGMIEVASDGTLFLDEIGELAPANQVKLLRLLQEGEYFPLGSDTPSYSTARIVAATNRDLEKLKNGGEFRNDLYFRLAAHQVTIPPLRDRLDDLPLLLDHFFEKAATDMGKKKFSYPKELLLLLSNYQFPGNVRELEAMVLDAVLQNRSANLSIETFKQYVSKRLEKIPTAASALPADQKEVLRFGQRLPTVKEAKKLLIAEALKRTGDNKSIAAKILGLTRQTLIRSEKED
jgi:DNA-binding NtrC family response regulator